MKLWLLMFVRLSVWIHTENTLHIERKMWISFFFSLFFFFRSDKYIIILPSMWIYRSANTIYMFISLSCYCDRTVCCWVPLYDFPQYKTILRTPTLGRECVCVCVTVCVCDASKPIFQYNTQRIKTYDNGQRKALLQSDSPSVSVVASKFKTEWEKMLMSFDLVSVETEWLMTIIWPCQN